MDKTRGDTLQAFFRVLAPKGPAANAAAMQDAQKLQSDAAADGGWLKRLTQIAEEQVAWLEEKVDPDFLKGNVFAQRAKENVQLLRNFKYRIGVVGVQSAGKTSVLNTLLGFPYMPTAEVVTTSCATSILYGETLSVSIVPRNGGDAVPIYLDKIDKALFEDMKDYVVRYLICEYGQTSLDCLTEDYTADSLGHPVVDSGMLHVEYGNLRHRAALVLHVLQFYVDQNAKAPGGQDGEEQERPKSVAEYDRMIQAADTKAASIAGSANEERLALMKRLKVPETMGEYDIEFYVDSPLLEDGLIFVDLPGKGSIVKAGNGNTAHDDILLETMGTCKAVMLLFQPGMKADDVEPLDDVITFFKEKKVEDRWISSTLIPVINKMDLPGAAGCHTTVDPIFKERNLPFTYAQGTFRVSARNAEQRIFAANPDMPLRYSAAGRPVSRMFAGMPVDPAMVEGRIAQGMEEAYQSSGFEALCTYLKSYAAISREGLCLEAILDVYRVLNAYASSLISRLHILEQLLVNGNAATVDITQFITVKFIQPVKEQFSEFYNSFGDKATRYLQQELSDKKEKVRSEFEEAVRKEHEALVKGLRSKAEDLKKNGIIGAIFSDVVLWRNTSGGRQVVEPNYTLFNEMKDLVEDIDYDVSFQYLQGMILDLHHSVQSYSQELEAKQKQKISDTLDYVRDASRQMRSGAMGSRDYDAATAEIIQTTFQEIEANCTAIMKHMGEKLAAVSTSDADVINRALKNALSAKNGAKSRYQEGNLKIFDGLVTQGVIMDNSYLIYKDNLVNVLDRMDDLGAGDDFMDPADLALSEISALYIEIIKNKVLKIGQLGAEVERSLTGFLRKVITDFSHSRQELQREIARLLGLLASMGPTLPEVELSSSQGQGQWQEIRAEYDEARSALAPYQREGK